MANQFHPREMLMQNGRNISDLYLPDITDENKPYLTPHTSITDMKEEPDFSLHDSVIYCLMKEDFKMIESSDDKALKESVLLKLNDILKLWMNKVNIEENIDSKSVACSEAKLLCYGSYKLGVSTPTGDIDALVLAPLYVDRNKHFFGTLFDLLASIAKGNNQIKELSSINYEHTMTPLIKMDFYGVSVDLVFACLPDVSLLDGVVLLNGLSLRENLSNDSLLRNMDEKMKRSYNGFRSAEMILNSLKVSDNEPENKLSARLDRFRVLLRCVKLLTKRQGINENKFGYPGGIAYAILCAKLIQLYPYYGSTALLERFLAIYSSVWDWDKWMVRITAEITNTNIAGSGFENQRRKGNNRFGGFQPPNINEMMLAMGMIERPTQLKRYMTIYTPAWPQMNSTHNISYATRKTLIQTFKDKHTELVEIIEGQNKLSEVELKIKWKEFFEPFNFFGSYSEYLYVLIVGNSEEHFSKWCGFVEAKLRLLTEKIEQAMSYLNFLIRPWPFEVEMKTARVKGLSRKVMDYSFKTQLFFGLKMDSNFDGEMDLTPFVCKFVEQLEKDWTKDSKPYSEIGVNLFIYSLSSDEIVVGEETTKIESISLPEPEYIPQSKRSLNDSQDIEDALALDHILS